MRYNGVNGAFIDVFVSAGSGGLDNNRGIVFGPDGNFYVSSGFPVHQVLRYDGLFDSDGDGFFTNIGDIDCNDTDSTIFPENIEILDGKDNDCDGVIDEPLKGSTWEPGLIISLLVLAGLIVYSFFVATRTKK